MPSAAGARAGARAALARKQNKSFYTEGARPAARYAEDGATPDPEFSKYDENIPTNGFYKAVRTSDDDEPSAEAREPPSDDYHREYKGPSSATPPTWNPPTHPPKPEEPPFSCVTWLFPWTRDGTIFDYSSSEPQEASPPMNNNESTDPDHQAKVHAARIKYESRQQSPKSITPPSMAPSHSQRSPLDSPRHTPSSVRSQSQSGDPHGGRTDRTNVTAQLLELEVRHVPHAPTPTYQ